MSAGDLRAWIAAHGPMPSGAAVIAYTGCAAYWTDGNTTGKPNYYNCGTGQMGFHQPGFSLRAVRWLIGHGALAN